MFLLFQSNLYVVLARGKGLKNSVQRDIFHTKNRLLAASYPPCGAWIDLQPI